MSFGLPHQPLHPFGYLHRPAPSRHPLTNNGFFLGLQWIQWVVVSTEVWRSGRRLSSLLYWIGRVPHSLRCREVVESSDGPLGWINPFTKLHTLYTLLDEELNIRYLYAKYGTHVPYRILLSSLKKQTNKWLFGKRSRQFISTTMNILSYPNIFWFTYLHLYITTRIVCIHRLLTPNQEREIEIER